MSGWWLALAIAANVAATAADLSTTARAVQLGVGREGNPLVAGPHRAPLKIGVTVGLSWGSIHLWRHGKPRSALLVSLVPASLYAAAAAHNHAITR